MKNLNIVDIFRSLSPFSPLNAIFAKSIAKLQKKINIFDNAKNIIETYLKSNRKVLSKAKIVSLFDSIDTLEIKIGFYCDILSKVSQKSLQISNESQPLTASSDMYNTHYYKEIGDTYGIETNIIESLKKFYTSLYLLQAKLQKANICFDKLPKQALYKIAYGAIHHSHHQQIGSNNGEWGYFFNEGECKEISQLMGYKSSYTKED